jgi:hypothetical protein
MGARCNYARVTRSDRLLVPLHLCVTAPCYRFLPWLASIGGASSLLISVLALVKFAFDPLFSSRLAMKTCSLCRACIESEVQIVIDKSMKQVGAMEMELSGAFRTE